MDPLEVLKALGDETRYAIYRELATATRAQSTQDLAERLDLHSNTVRLHLERLRHAGLVEVEPVHRGTVGRPQHVYALAPGAPGLGFEPPSSTLLAGLLASLAERSGADEGLAIDIGRSWGSESVRRTRERDCVRALEAEMDRLGFDPSADGEMPIAFLHCPFRELAEAYPELVCNLHRGICEGIVETVGGGSVTDFATLYDREPCHVAVAPSTTGSRDAEAP